MFTKQDPWEEAANEGIQIKFAKARWTVDSDEVQTGEDGFRLCALMDTAMHGAVKWSNDRSVERRLQPYARVAPSKDALELGWSPYTSFQCVGANGNYFGQLMTFWSSTWGARYAFRSLIRPWLQKGRREFPICSLESKAKKNDVNANIDPIFKIVGWAPRSDFTAFLPSGDELPPTGAVVEAIDDNIPF